MRTPTIWILVADGTRARAVRSPRQPGSDGMHQPLETTFEAETEIQPLREIMADKPGRAFESAGVQRSAMEYHSDPVRAEMEAFARLIVEALEARRVKGEFDQLIVCAAPRMLGAIREAMPESLAATVTRQVDKDFTKLPEVALRDTLVVLVAGPG